MICEHAACGHTWTQHDAKTGARLICHCTCFARPVAGDGKEAIDTLNLISGSSGLIVKDGPTYLRLARVVEIITCLTARLAEVEAERDELFIAATNNLSLAAENDMRAQEAEGRLVSARAEGAREGWIRACVFYVDMDAEEDGSKYLAEMHKRWPLIPTAVGG